jgi:hypothetical protein
MERFIEYVVQFWVERYEYWSDAAQPRGEDENMFTLPRVGHETEDAAREHLALLRTAGPTSAYRLVRRTTIVEPI